MNESSSSKASQSTIIDISNLCLTFETQTEPVHALSDINLQVNSGDFLSFIGPSGCGKTTLLRVITRNSVVLPQPLGPIKDKKSPELTCKLISESACTGSVCVSNVRHKLLISIIVDCEALLDDDSFMILFFG